jgi:WD40 repeat protein
VRQCSYSINLDSQQSDQKSFHSNLSVDSLVIEQPAFYWPLAQPQSQSVVQRVHSACSKNLRLCFFSPLFSDAHLFINRLIFTRDDRYLLTGSADTTIKFWDMQNGQLTRTITIK